MNTKVPRPSDATQPILTGLDDDIFKGSRKVASAILAITQTLAFAPLFVIVVLQDVHLKMAILLNTALCICLAVGNYWFHRMQVVKVYPKSLDTFLLLLYISLIPVAIAHNTWLQYWLAPLHHGIVACFMWLSILSPLWDNFTMQALQDRLPQQLCNLPGTQRCALQVSQLWAGVLTVMALAGLGPTLTGQNSPWCATRVVCNYVIGLLALLVAAAVQRWVLSRSVTAAQEWQQAVDPETGVHAEVGLQPAVARPLGPFLYPVYPTAFHASPGSSAQSNLSTSSGGDAAHASDVAAMQVGTAVGQHQGWWQLRMPKKAAGEAAAAAAESRPAV